MKLAVEVACPGCGRKLKQEIGRMHPGASRTCSSCGVVIRFTGDDGRKVQREMNKLEKTLENLGRRLSR